MANRKSLTVEAVVEFLTTPAPREASLLELFEIADPERELTYPDMLRACCTLLDRAAEDARRRGEPAEAHRRIKDALRLAAVADLVLGIQDRAVRFRLQDIDEPGLARLIELGGWLAPRAEAVEPIVAALRAVLPGVLAYVEEIDPVEHGTDGDR